MFARARAAVRRAVVNTAVTTTLVVGTLELTTHLPTQGRSSAFYHQAADTALPIMKRFLGPKGTNERS